MSKRDSELLIGDMLEAAKKVRIYVGEKDFEEFKGDDKTVDAVIRNLEIVGEAASHLSMDAKNKSSDVKWERVITYIPFILRMVATSSESVRILNFVSAFTTTICGHSSRLLASA